MSVGMQFFRIRSRMFKPLEHFCMTSLLKSAFCMCCSALSFIGVYGRGALSMTVLGWTFRQPGLMQL